MCIVSIAKHVNFGRSTVACFLQFMDRGGFEEALESLECLMASYAELGQPDKPNEAYGADARIRPVF